MMAMESYVGIELQTSNSLVRQGGGDSLYRQLAALYNPRLAPIEAAQHDREQDPALGDARLQLCDAHGSIRACRRQ